MASKSPAGLGRVGAAFWRKVVADYAPSLAEADRLLMLCRLKDRIAAEAAIIAAEGLTVAGAAGQPRPHPMLSQLRADERLADQLLARLDLVDDDGESLSDGLTARARAANRARWGGPKRPGDELADRRKHRAVGA